MYVCICGIILFQLSKRRNLDIVKKEDGVQVKDIPVKDGSDESVNDNQKSHDDKSCDKKDLELNDVCLQFVY